MQNPAPSRYLDYRLVVLADACLDGDAEVHRVLTEKVFPRQADVLTRTSGWNSYVGASGFEPPTSWSRTRRANRAALRPELLDAQT